MRVYSAHIEEFEFDEPILVQYYIIPPIAPSPRTMSNPMGTDDGCGPECIIMSARDLSGQPYNLTRIEELKIIENLLDRYEGE